MRSITLMGDRKCWFAPRPPCFAADPNYRLEACHGAQPYFAVASVLTPFNGLRESRHVLWDECVGDGHFRRCDLLERVGNARFASQATLARRPPWTRIWHPNNSGSSATSHLRRARDRRPRDDKSKVRIPVWLDGNAPRETELRQAALKATDTKRPRRRRPGWSSISSIGAHQIVRTLGDLLDPILGAWRVAERCLMWWYLAGAAIVAAVAGCFLVVRATVRAVADVANGNDTLG
jgi:hypothetical protein